MPFFTKIHSITSEILSKKGLDKVPRFVLLVMLFNLKTIKLKLLFKLKLKLLSTVFNRKKHALNGIP